MTLFVTRAMIARDPVLRASLEIYLQPEIT